MDSTFKQFLILFALSGAIFFTNLGAARLWDRDEPRNAGCAKEMLERGNWVVPIFNDELRPQKPVLLYWLMMTAYGLFGVNEFAARFWSALLSMGTVFGTYIIARRLFHSKIAFLASIVLSTTLMFDVASRAATPDALLIFCGTMAIMCYVLGTFKREGEAEVTCAPSGFPSESKYVVPMYVSLGVGTLAKGPVGFLLPMAIIGMFMLRIRLSSKEVVTFSQQSIWRWLISATWRTVNPVHFAKTLWVMKPLTAVVMILLVASPWYILVGLQTEGDFLKQFFLNENFGRATTVLESHSGGPWYYPVAMSIGFFPWSVFIVPVTLFVIAKLRSTDETNASPAILFLVCWVAVQVALFSLASTKLPSYVTPCYPALAILTAATLDSFVMQKKWVPAYWIRLAACSLALVGLLLGFGLMFLGTEYLDGTYALGLLGLFPFLGGLAAYWAVASERRILATRIFATSAFLFCLGFFGLGTVWVDQHRQTSEVLDIMSESTDEVATFGCLESSWVFYSNRRIFELAREPQNSDGHSRVDREKNWHPKPRMTPEQFASQEAGLVLTTVGQVEHLLSRLPGYEIKSTAPYFLKDEKLVLLGPQKALFRTSQVKGEQELNR